MGSITGGGSGKGGSGSGGGQYNYGVSPFDINAIMSAMGLNEQAIGNRYDQLGLGGSTMQGQDIGTTPSITGGAAGQGAAALGQLETANQGSAALNPAQQSNAQTLSNQAQAGSALGSLSSLIGSGTKLLG